MSPSIKPLELSRMGSRVALGWPPCWILAVPCRIIQQSSIPPYSRRSNDDGDDLASPAEHPSVVRSPASSPGLSSYSPSGLAAAADERGVASRPTETAADQFPNHSRLFSIVVLALAICACDRTRMACSPWDPSRCRCRQSWCRFAPD